MAWGIPREPRTGSVDPHEANPFRSPRIPAVPNRQGRVDRGHKQRKHQSMSSKPSVPGRVDPIAAFVKRRAEHKGPPVPLEALSIDVTVRGGLALVETTRTYHNGEDNPIEALLTFPVPVQAAFFGLTAKVGARHLTGIAQKREEARDTYEEAVEEGKTAVLHEEVLRGVHSLSVANLTAGERIEVTIRWAEVLRCTRTRGRLRIPMTVGEVYGSSGLLDADDLTIGGKTLCVKLRVWHDAGSIKLGHTPLESAADGPISLEVPSNRPIDIQVNDWKPGVLHGQGRSGKAVSLRVEPAGDGNENLDVAVLVDRSGSMSALCSTEQGTQGSVHERVLHALLDLPEQLRTADRVALWQFDNKCEPLGAGLPVPPTELADLVYKLKPPRGGTEIGNALKNVIGADAAPDILLITDGLSYELNVQQLATLGHRIFVVLVGERSLEASVGHLAALTGGDVYFSYGQDISTALHACVLGLRLRGERSRFVGGTAPQRIRAHRGNAVVEAWWDPREELGKTEVFSSAVAAYAAGLALGSMSEPAATQLAVSDGLVTHLTSLVLVDEEGVRSRDLPATRKIKLPTPPTSGYGPATVHPKRVVKARAFRDSPRAKPRKDGRARARYSIPPLFGGTELIERVARSIDWSLYGDTLTAGVLDGIDPETAHFIQQRARRISRKRAWRTGFWGAALATEIDPILLVIMCLATLSARESRDAERVRRRLLERVRSAIHGALQVEFGRPSAIHKALLAEFK